MQPTISVLLTTYNRPQLLEHSIRSVLRQDIADFELLILDDASTDHTPDIVEKFIDLRIRYIRQKKNVGFSENFRNGVKQAKGKYLFLLSDDDMIVNRDTFSTIIEKMEVHNSGVGVTSLLFYEDDPYKPTAFFSLGKNIYLPPSKENILETVPWHFGFMSGLVYRRELIQMDDIIDDLWLAHLKPLLRILISHGCYYFSDIYILAKNSTSGNISHLDTVRNSGYHLLKQFQMYRDLDPSEKRYRLFIHLHVRGVANSLPGIKYFTSTRNMISITRLLVQMDVSVLAYWRLYLSFLSAFITPIWLLKIIRQIRIHYFEGIMIRRTETHEVIAQVKQILTYEKKNERL